jgi:hypothetical protein
MDIETLQKLDKMPLEKAREEALKMLSPKTKQRALNRLQYDLDKAPNSAEVSRIMWQVYLSGSGLGTVGSSWRKEYHA